MNRQYLSDITKLVSSRIYILFAGSVLMVFLARWLSPDVFGKYQLVMSLIMIFPIMVDWGISSSLPRYLAEARSRDKTIVYPTLLAGVRVKLVAMVIGGLILIALEEPLVKVFKLDGVAHLLPIGFLVLLGFSLHEFFLKLSEGFQKFKAVPVVIFLKNSGDLVISLTLVLLGFGVAGALLGKLAATWIATMVGLSWLMRSAIREYAGSAVHTPGVWRKIMTYGTWLILIDVADRVLLYGDRLLINFFLGPEMVGLYSIPARLAVMSQLVGLSVASVLGPAMGKDPQGTRPVLKTGFRFLMAFYTLLAVLVLGLADRIVLTLFGDDYAGSISSLRLFAGILPLIGISPVFSLVLNYRGAARQRTVFIGIAIVITMTGNLILIPRFGILGAAMAMGLGQLVYVGSQGFFCSRMEDLDRFWPPLFAKVFLIGLVSLMGIGLARIVFPGALSAWIAGVVMSIVYGILLFKWGVIKRSELMRLVPQRRGRPGNQ